MPATVAKLGDIEAGKPPGSGKYDSAALRELEKRNGRLEQEAEVMRRAVAYLSHDTNPK